MSTPFQDGFQDELIKLSGAALSTAKGVGKWVSKKPFVRGVFPALTAFAVGSAGLAGMRESKRKKRRIIAAQVDRYGRARPSQMAHIDWHNALGLKKRVSNLRLQRNSRNFNPDRGKV